MVRPRVSATLALTLVGCVQPYHVLREMDGGGGDAGTSEAMVFEEPVLVAELADAEVLDPTLSDDERELFFLRQGLIMRATRSAITEPFSDVVAVAELDEGDRKTDPRLAPGGLALYLTSYREGNGDIFVSERLSIESAWSAPTRVPGLSTADQDSAPTLSNDQTEVYLSRRLGDQFDIVRATRADPDAGWTDAGAVAVLSTTANESNPHYRDTTLIFDRDDAGDRDLYVATRADLDAPFSSPARLEGVASAAVERDGWLSPDGQRLYFVSDRSGTNFLYVAQRR